MSDPKRVLRLLDSESGASDAVRSVLEAAKDHEPSPEALASLHARLAAQLPPGALSNVAKPAGTAGAAASAKGAAGFLTKGVVGLATIATLSAGAYELLRKPATANVPNVATVASIATASPSMEPPAVEATPVEATAEPLPPVDRAVSPRSISTPTPTASAREPEATLLSRAHDALLHGDPATALAITQQHARLYPNGLLTQERERIAIEALMAEGDKQRARARANAFYKSYPDSPHRARLERLIPP